MALAAGDFVWSVGMAGAPLSFSEEDDAESSRSMHLKGIERYMTALHEAKRDLAIVTADGVVTGLETDLFKGNPSQADLQRAYDSLTKTRASRRRS